MRQSIPGAVIAGDDEAVVTAVAPCIRAAGESMDGPAALIVIDDAERVADADGSLAALVGERHPNVVVVAAGRPDALRTMYGHWTAVVRRGRIGLVMTTGADTDGDLLGETLPRRVPIAARPGLAWLFDGSGRRLVQVAYDTGADGFAISPREP